MLLVDPVKDAVVTNYSHSEFGALGEFRETNPGKEWNYVGKKPKDPVPSSSHHAATIPKSHTSTSRSSKQLPSRRTIQGSHDYGFFEEPVRISERMTEPTMRASLDSLPNSQSFYLHPAPSEHRPPHSSLIEFLTSPGGAGADAFAALSGYMATAPTMHNLIAAAIQESQNDQVEPSNASNNTLNESPVTGASSPDDPPAGVTETEGRE
ncbi:hypothetical protein M231_05728 [Tremella mesenterica]|uniref:Uncharacterized protein n=1 Tax=Tremella mesenterica TaxID=5217 RepID=A0A4Q1BHE7_TREME|nr:hypothetical protein M231_05728 [Tremella mesenterica]